MGGRDFLSRVTMEVAVMVHLSVDPVIGMVLDPFVAIVLFVPGIYLVGF